MSIQCVAWVLEESEATGIDRLVLLSLANHAGKSEWIAWPSLVTLAKESRVDRRTVIRAIKRLEVEGHIEVTRATNRNNAYRVVVAESHQGVVTEVVTPESPGSDTAVTRTVINQEPTPLTPQRGERGSLRSNGASPRQLAAKRADAVARLAAIENAAKFGRNLARAGIDDEELVTRCHTTYPDDPERTESAIASGREVIDKLASTKGSQ